MTLLYSKRRILTCNIIMTMPAVVSRGNYTTSEYHIPYAIRLWFKKL